MTSDPPHTPSGGMSAAGGRAATSWQLRTRSIQFGRLPALMGIVNVTPDSFSDGGEYVTSQAAVQHGLDLVQQGAEILDVGGESTRPYATPVDVATELGRIREVIRELSARSGVPVSIDTSKSEVARAALEWGAEIINDVTGLEGDPRMVDVAADHGAGICVMHMRGRPQTMQDDPRYSDVTGEIHAYLRLRRDALLARGIWPERICLDPGIGFGKTHEHNLTLLNQVGHFHDLDCPLLVGHSRKGFIGKVLGDRTADPTYGTVGVALALARRAVQVIRVHDVAAVRQALLLFEASGGLSS